MNCFHKDSPSSYQLLTNTRVCQHPHSSTQSFLFCPCYTLVVSFYEAFIFLSTTNISCPISHPLSYIKRTPSICVSYIFLLLFFSLLSFRTFLFRYTFLGVKIHSLLLHWIFFCFHLILCSFLFLFTFKILSFIYFHYLPLSNQIYLSVFVLFFTVFTFTLSFFFLSQQFPCFLL